MAKTAIVIGATGLVGHQLVRLLLNDGRYAGVKVFVRRPTGVRAAKLEQHIIDFDRPGDWSARLTGDVLFATLGTTLEKAGGKDAQYRVDYAYQYEAARVAAGNGVASLVLVSSVGADPRARTFYARMKGELEQAVRELPFRKIVILRPSFLVGERPEPRMGERLAVPVLRLLARLLPPLRRYRPVEAAHVARAMIELAERSPDGFSVFESEQLAPMAKPAGKARA